jgi:hypothetical protein
MNVVLRTGECIRLTQNEAVAMKLIDDDRCNYYLNLSRQSIPLDVWETIQRLILSDKVYPPITTIDIKNSNLSINDVYPELRNIIIY